MQGHYFHSTQKACNDVILYQQQHPGSRIWDAWFRCRSGHKIDICFPHWRRRWEGESRHGNLPALTPNVACVDRAQVQASSSYHGFQCSRPFDFRVWQQFKLIRRTVRVHGQPNQELVLNFFQSGCVRHCSTEPNRFGAAVSHTTRLEKVQHKFLIWLAVNSNRPSD